MIKKEIKGITIVALVITIIVLLILSGVALSFSLGENGIFKRAQEGAKLYQNSSENELKEKDEISNFIGNYINENKEEQKPIDNLENEKQEENKSNSPKTGDIQIEMLITVMVISAIGIVIILRKKFKK